MKKTSLFLLLIVLSFIGCGGDSSSSLAHTTEEVESDDRTTPTVNNTTENYTLAKDNTLHDVNHSFSNFRVLVYVDSEVSGLSTSTKAIYGKINDESKHAVLSLNSNYKDGTAIIVKVFKDGKLVGESLKLTLSGETLDFSNIKTR